MPIGREHSLRDPWESLRIETPRLVLRLPTVGELHELAALARAGVHDPAEMPFVLAWTDRAHLPSFDHEFVDFHLEARRDARPADWRLELGVFLDGTPVGVQGLHGEQLSRRREVQTGSWLGVRHQCAGIGTEMRTAVLAFAFETLGPRAAYSAAWVGNHSSLRVSRKLGYVDVGSRTASPRGEPLEHRVLRLDDVNFHRRIPVTVFGAEGLLPSLGAV